MKFTIKSYLKNPYKNINNMNVIEKKLSQFFINIDDHFEVQKIKKYIDQDYIDGYIFLQYKDEVILDFHMYDLIDQLWSYIINIMEKYLSEGYASSYFPDQPIKIFISNVKNNNAVIELGIGDKKFVLPKNELFIAILESAMHFFSKLIELSLISIEQYTLMSKRIQNLQCLINTNKE